jgi:hypothetical protein
VIDCAEHVAQINSLLNLVNDDRTALPAKRTGRRVAVVKASSRRQRNLLAKHLLDQIAVPLALASDVNGFWDGGYPKIRSDFFSPR